MKCRLRYRVLAGISTISNVLVQILPGSTLLQEFQQRIREKKEKNPLNLFWLCRVKPKMSESFQEKCGFCILLKSNFGNVDISKIGSSDAKKWTFKKNVASLDTK